MSRPDTTVHFVFDSELSLGYNSSLPLPRHQASGSLSLSMSFCVTVIITTDVLVLFHIERVCTVQHDLPLLVGVTASISWFKKTPDTPPQSAT
jgi:hypothetical protein